MQRFTVHARRLVPRDKSKERLCKNRHFIRIYLIINSVIHVFLLEKSLRKWGSNGQNLKKIARLNLQNLVFLLAKKRYFFVIAFKMLEMEFKFMYTLLTANV